MPEIILIGWIHTIIAIIALIAGYYTLAVFKVITPAQRSGQIYLVCTFCLLYTSPSPRDA